jgi:hypothetical protein
MPITARPVADVLAELADALRTTDMTWPRNDDENFLEHRALAWSRCRDHLPDWPEHTELSNAERDRLLHQFTATVGNDHDDGVTRSLAELFLDYGQVYIISGPLCWSPGEAMVPLTDWLPRKAILDARLASASATRRVRMRSASRRRTGEVEPAVGARVQAGVDLHAVGVARLLDRAAIALRPAHLWSLIESMKIPIDQQVIVSTVHDRWSNPVGPRGIEPRTRGLKVRCSAD